MYFKKFDDLTFADHYMFEKVLQNPEICQELIERLLKIKIDHIEYPEIEKTISPYYETKGVRLDVYIKDSDKVFDDEKDVVISAFLEYICNQKTVDDFTSKIDSFVQKIKHQEVNKKEYQTMNLHDRDNFRRGKKEGIIEGIQQGISQGEYQKAIETAKNFLKMGIPIEQVAQGTGLSIDEINKLMYEDSETSS